MKKAVQLSKLLILLLVLVLLISAASISAGASCDASLDKIEARFKEGAYWNGEFDVAWECHGWALYATYLAYGEHAKYDWKREHEPSNTYDLKPGDIVSFYRTSSRSTYNTHTVLIIDVRDNCYITAECNYPAANTVHYGGEYPKNFYNGSNMFGVEYVWSAPYALNNSSINSYIVGETVKITAKSGLNVRSGPASRYNVVTKLPKNTIITVTGYPIQSDTDSHLWQYCPQYNGYVASTYLKHVSGSIYPEGSFKLVPKCSPESAIAVQGRSYYSGTKIWLWELHEDEGCQTFWFQPVQATDTGEIYYAIINERSGLALDIDMSTCNLIQYQPHYGANQLFKLVNVSNGYYRIESMLGYSIDIQAGGKENGTDVMIWYNDNSDNAQLFRLIKQ